MSLSLPADCEKFIPEGEGFDYLHSPAVYALTLRKPRDLESAWDQEFDARPPYFEELQEASEIIYVGESEDVLHRLEQHRDGDIKVGVLQRVCEIESVRNLWWMDSKAEAEEQESALAIALQQETDGTYVHQR